jgi:hypothetical protein
MKYYIWCHARKKWWKPYSWGYTEDLLLAGCYLEDDARAIVDKANRYSPEVEESMWPVEMVRRIHSLVIYSRLPVVKETLAS